MTSHGLHFVLGCAAVLALSACNGIGSLGEIDTDSDTGTEPTGGMDDASGDDDGGSLSASGGMTAGSASNGNTDAGTSGSSGATATDDGLDSGGTGTPGQCEGEGNCVLFPINCNDVQCGGLSMFDADGCVRTNCTADPLVCADGERCYRPMDFGGCQSSAVGCVDDEVSMTCQCSTLPDCGGAYCLPDAEWPSPEAGPAGNAIIQESCAPDDGPAFELRVGIASDACGTEPTAGDPWLRIRLDGIDPVAGTYGYGEYLGGQGNYDAGDGIQQPASSGQVVIDSWDGASVTGSYDMILPDGTFLADELQATYCAIDPMCG